MPKVKQPSSFTSQSNRDSAQRSVRGSTLTGYGLTKCNDSTNKSDAKAEAFLFGIAVPALMSISRDVALIMVKTLKVGAAP